MRFFEQRAVITGDAANHVRIDADTVVREHREGRHMFEQLHIRGAESQRQIRWKRGCNAETVCYIHDGVDTYVVRELYRGDNAATHAHARQAAVRLEGFV